MDQDQAETHSPNVTKRRKNLNAEFDDIPKTDTSALKTETYTDKGRDKLDKLNRKDIYSKGTGFPPQSCFAISSI